MNILQNERAIEIVKFAEECFNPNNRECIVNLINNSHQLCNVTHEPLINLMTRIYKIIHFESIEDIKVIISSERFVEYAKVYDVFALGRAEDNKEEFVINSILSVIVFYYYKDITEMF